MRAKTAGALLSLLLTVSLLWGNCALCPPSGQQPSPQHDCCKPATQSHCGPAPQDSAKQQCPKHSLAAETYQKAKPEAASALDSPAPSAAPPAQAAPASGKPAAPEFDAPAASPPQLYLLHSVLLI